MIHVGDCIEVMAGMEPDSVDAIVTDPPYGLEFMGKEWDRFATTKRKAELTPRGQGHSTSAGPFLAHAVNEYRAGTPFQAWCEAWGREALRVTKPGGYLLAFGGTRTHHRLVCGLEDAGWIIRDELDWIYASGFPKGKANLKPAHEPIVLARKPGPLRPLAIDACRIGTTVETWPQSRSYAPGQIQPGGVGETQETGPVPPGRWPSNVLLSDPALFDTANPGVVGSGAVDVGGGFGVRGDGPTDGRTSYALPGQGQTVGYGDTGGYSRFFIIPKADRQDREPFLKDAAVLLHQSRGECDKLSAWESEGQSPAEQTDSTSPARATSAATSTDDSPSDTSPPGNQRTGESPRGTRSTTSTATSKTTDSPTSSSLTPLPTSASTPAANSATENGGSLAESAESSSLWGPLTGTSAEKDGRSTVAAGPATSAKSSKRSSCALCGKPLPRVGTHPTTKPTDLMRHLIRLVTPSGGLVLDPFGGSGTTAVAAELEGFRWVLVEKEPEYVAIAEARLNGVQRGLGLDVAAPTTPQKRSTGHWPKERTAGSEGWGFTGQTGLEERYDKPEEAA